jgi:hypothetical protein
MRDQRGRFASRLGGGAPARSASRVQRTDQQSKLSAKAARSESSRSVAKSATATVARGTYSGVQVRIDLNARGVRAASRQTKLAGVAVNRKVQAIQGLERSARLSMSGNQTAARKAYIRAAKRNRSSARAQYRASRAAVRMARGSRGFTVTGVVGRNMIG